LREEHTLRVFPNRLPGKEFGPKSEEIIGGWIQQQKEESSLFLFVI
jgi:hypothetical protein